MTEQNFPDNKYERYEWNYIYLNETDTCCKLRFYDNNVNKEGMKRYNNFMKFDE